MALLKVLPELKEVGGGRLFPAVPSAVRNWEVQTFIAIRRQVWALKVRLEVQELKKRKKPALPRRRLVELLQVTYVFPDAVPALPQQVPRRSDLVFELVVGVWRLGPGYVERARPGVRAAGVGRAHRVDKRLGQETAGGGDVRRRLRHAA
ncbi:hypothetical protein [Salinibacter ruber]|uniref:hypothetical protein n=1 Tax=Salinibacter ruber TaxID=146919 RepID=UPI0021697AFF|nr:hypothetical protein [Salinibacter ruber]